MPVVTKQSVILSDQARELVTVAEREEWLTVKEFAARKRVSEETVRRWLRAGKLIAERTIGEHGHWRIRREQQAV